MRKEEVTIAEVLSKDENIAIKDNARGVTGFLERISPEIRDTFTDQQIAAINEAFEPARHSINIRVSPLRRYQSTHQLGPFHVSLCHILTSVCPDLTD